MKIGRLAKTLAAGVNVKRRAKGLLPRAVITLFDWKSCSTLFSHSNLVHSPLCF